MSWWKLAAGSGSTGVVISDNDRTGATENVTAVCASLNLSLAGASIGAVSRDLDDDVDAMATLDWPAGGTKCR